MHTIKWVYSHFHLMIFQHMPISDEVLLYIRNLEDRVGQLESGSEFPYKPVFPISPLSSKAKEQVEEDDEDEEEVVHGKEEGGVRPESVSNAMKVLEVHEDMLERGETGLAGEDLGDGEKALVREMCNVSRNFLCLHFLQFFLLGKTMSASIEHQSSGNGQ